MIYITKPGEGGRKRDFLFRFFFVSVFDCACTTRCCNKSMSFSESLQVFDAFLGERGSQPGSPWRFPFPNDVLEVGSSRQNAVSAEAVLQIGKTLRCSREYWEQCVRHLSGPGRISVGSMALVMTVLVDASSQPHFLVRADDVPALKRGRLFNDMHQSLCHKGLNSRYASAMALDVIRDAAVKNAHLLGTITTLMRDSREHVLVFRLVLKPAKLVTTSPDNQRVMFSDSHANAGVLDTVRRTIVFVEPCEGVVKVPGLEAVMLSIFQPRLRGYIFICNWRLAGAQTRHRTFQLPNDRLCTIWSALFALLFLAFRVTTIKEFEDALSWAHFHKSVLMRLFLTHAARVLKTLGTSLLDV